MYAVPPTRGVDTSAITKATSALWSALQGTGSNPAPRSHSQSSILSVGSGSRSATRRGGVSAGAVGTDSMKADMARSGETWCWSIWSHRRQRRPMLDCAGAPAHYISNAETLP